MIRQTARAALTPVCSITEDQRTCSEHKCLAATDQNSFKLPTTSFLPCTTAHVSRVLTWPNRYWWLSKPTSPDSASHFLNKTSTNVTRDGEIFMTNMSSWSQHKRSCGNFERMRSPRENVRRTERNTSVSHTDLRIVTRETNRNVLSCWACSPKTSPDLTKNIRCFRQCHLKQPSKGDQPSHQCQASKHFPWRKGHSAVQFSVRKNTDCKKPYIFTSSDTAFLHCLDNQSRTSTDWGYVSKLRVRSACIFTIVSA